MKWLKTAYHALICQFQGSVVATMMVWKICLAKSLLPQDKQEIWKHKVTKKHFIGHKMLFSQLDKQSSFSRKNAIKIDTLNTLVFTSCFL